jgi:hypothetical protein
VTRGDWEGTYGCSGGAFGFFRCKLSGVDGRENSFGLALARAFRGRATRGGGSGWTRTFGKEGGWVGGADCGAIKRDELAKEARREDEGERTCFEIGREDDVLAFRNGRGGSDGFVKGVPVVLVVVVGGRGSGRSECRVDEWVEMLLKPLDALYREG